MTTVDGNCLAGVSAGTLCALRDRATEATRPDGVIDDPLAVELFDAIGYDYAKFGKPNQLRALRVLTVDAVTADCSRTLPKACRWWPWPRAWPAGERSRASACLTAMSHRPCPPD